MAKIECTEGRYEGHDVWFGKKAYKKVHRWYPEVALVECDCGERSTLTRSETTCAWCGADHEALVREELVPQQLEDETARPWYYDAGDREESRDALLALPGSA